MFEGMERATSTQRSTIHGILSRSPFRTVRPRVIPRSFTERDRRMRIDVCHKLLVSERKVNWANFIIAQKMWISYEQTANCSGSYRRRTLNPSQSEMRPAAYHEIFPEGPTVRSAVFREQLPEAAFRLPVSHQYSGKFLIVVYEHILRRR